MITNSDEFIRTNCVIISYPAYLALNQLFEKDVIDSEFIQKINRLDKKTSVVEVHFALNSKLDTTTGGFSSWAIHH